MERESEMRAGYAEKRREKSQKTLVELGRWGVVPTRKERRTEAVRTRRFVPGLLVRGGGLSPLVAVGEGGDERREDSSAPEDEGSGGVASPAISAIFPVAGPGSSDLPLGSHGLTA